MGCFGLEVEKGGVKFFGIEQPASGRGVALRDILGESEYAEHLRHGVCERDDAAPHILNAAYNQNICHLKADLPGQVSSRQGRLGIGFPYKEARQG